MVGVIVVVGVVVGIVDHNRDQNQLEDFSSAFCSNCFNGCKEDSTNSDVFSNILQMSECVNESF